jgi:hypothetical protein
LGHAHLIEVQISLVALDDATAIRIKGIGGNIHSDNNIVEAANFR